MQKGQFGDCKEVCSLDGRWEEGSLSRREELQREVPAARLSEGQG